MYTDKQKAIKKKRRIPEKNIWIISLIGGSIGTSIGMFIFHHKTKHLNFRLILPSLATITIFLIIYLTTTK